MKGAASPATGRSGASAAAAVLLREPPVLVRWPPPHLPAGSGNDAGLVLEVGDGRGRLLFMADVDSTVEDSLAVAPGLGLLKVAHHGAASSTGTRFLGRVRPAIALLSVGARNRFGHPAPALLERLRVAGARVLRTDDAGALWFEWSRRRHRGAGLAARATRRPGAHAPRARAGPGLPRRPLRRTRLPGRARRR